MKNYEVSVPITGYMKIYLRAEDVLGALQKAGEIALEMEQDSSQMVIPNLCNWKIDRTVQPIIVEKGESDE